MTISIDPAERRAAYYCRRSLPFSVLLRRSLVIVLALDGVPVLALDIVIVLSGPA